ncbi:MAG: undecaprenyl-diphosphate phosphatase [Solirubrobacteraceae bacterium]
MSGPEGPTVSQALALGALHGPSELMPISSSAHVTVVPYLLGWDYGEADPDLRKAFEVALHAGTALALLIGLRDEVEATIRSMTPSLAARLVVASIPAALVGFTLEQPIERRLGTPETIAAGMILGALAMGWADRSARDRHCTEAGMRDALWLGIAQACALVPGVSRNGATLTAARRRRFERVDANRLSRHVALPVIGGATALKALRLARRGLPDGMAVPFAAGAIASFCSTLASTRVLRAVERDAHLSPYVVYRLLIAGAVLRRARRVAAGAGGSA